MATYGYSTPYSGARIQPLPPGYMEAATAPGRNIAAGIAAAGQNIGEGIKKYLQNREEENYLNAKIDAGLAQYMDAGRQGPLPSGATADMANLMNVIGERNADKLASGKANKAEKLAIAHALETYGQKELQALQINEAKRKVQEREQLGLLQRYALGLPETRQVDVRLGDIQVQPEGPPQLVPDKQLEDIRSQIQPLVEQYNRQNAPGANRQEQIGPVGTSKETFRPSGISAAWLGQAAPIMGDVPVAAPQAQAQSQPLESQIDQLAERGRQRVQQLGGQEGRLLYPEQVNVPVQGKMDEQIPYAETRRQLAQFAAAQNMSPEAFQSIDKILEIAGRTRPIQVEQQTIPGGAQVIRADGKIEILPPPKPVEGKDLTEAQSAAAGFAARMAYNEQVIKDTAYTPGALTEFALMPERMKSERRKAYESAKNNWIAAQLRKESGAAIGEKEYEDANAQYFPQAGDSESVIRQKAQRRKVAEMAQRAAVGKYADFYISQILGGVSGEDSKPETRRSDSGTTYQVRRN